MKIFVADLIGEFCVTLEDGQILFEKLSVALGNDEPIEIDFSNVRIVVSPFLNAAIGQLLRDFDTAKLNRLLSITNLPLGVEAIVARVIENAKNYYHDPAYRDAVDTIMTEEDTEEEILEHGV
jgi:hypothetical protein